MTEPKNTFEIHFYPMGLKQVSSADESLLESAHKAGVDLVSLCGGQGTCKQCRVRIVDRAANLDALPEDSKAGKECLACLTYPEKDLIVQVPATSLSSPQRLQIEGLDLKIAPQLSFAAYPLTLEPASLSDTTGDDDRLLAALKKQYQVSFDRMDTGCMQTFSKVLRESDYKVTVLVRDNEVIDIAPQNSPCLGVAVDLGTTKIAAYLLDLESGKILDAMGAMNPQIAHGEDIITRLNKAQKSDKDALSLQQMLVGTLNDLIGNLCKKSKVSPFDVKEMVVAGNTGMHHLFLKLSVSQLSRAPYVASIRNCSDVKARDLGIHIANGARVHVLANVAGYVGGDHVAMLMGINIQEAKGPLLAIDIGTNTEISLVANGRILCLSCASGPAFEGFHIQNGMRAATGAIEHVKLVDGQLNYYTINGAEPAGICGSGLFELLAQLRKNGIVDSSGKIMPVHPNVRKSGSVYEFVVVDEKESQTDRPICLTQKDIRELQLAKAAIRTGIDILLSKSGLAAADLEQIVVAGAFGTYLDLSSAMTVGMFPKLPLHRFKQVGNAAGTGAQMALISLKHRLDGIQMARRMEYIELAGTKEFNTAYLRSLEIN